MEVEDFASGSHDKGSARYLLVASSIQLVVKVGCVRAECCFSHSIVSDGVNIDAVAMIWRSMSHDVAWICPAFFILAAPESINLEAIVLDRLWE